MLSQALYWTDRTKDADGWFWKTQEEWQEETGMSRREQETARKALRSSGLWQEELRGAPARLYYRVDVGGVELSLLANKYGGMRQTSMAECAKLVWRNPPNITENTTETTTEITVASGGSSSAVAFYTNNFPGTLTEVIADELVDLVDTYGDDVVVKAMRTAVLAERRTLRYVNGILRRSGTDGGGKGQTDWTDPKWGEQQQQAAGELPGVDASEVTF